MHVIVDNVWATPSSLHMRVTVWGSEKRWRHRYDAHVPLEEIPVEALAPLLAQFKHREAVADLEVQTLFCGRCGSLTDAETHQLDTRAQGATPSSSAPEM